MWELFKITLSLRQPSWVALIFQLKLTASVSDVLGPTWATTMEDGTMSNRTLSVVALAQQENNFKSCLGAVYPNPPG